MQSNFAFVFLCERSNLPIKTKPKNEEFLTQECAEKNIHLVTIFGRSIGMLKMYTK